MRRAPTQHSLVYVQRYTSVDQWRFSNWRYSEYGTSIHDSDSDPVVATLNSVTINIAECDF